MPQLLEVTEETRKAQVAQVFFLAQSDPEMTVKKACKDVGITEAQYYRWIRESRDFIEAIRESVEGVYREEFIRIMLARPQVLDKVIKDGLSQFTPAADRLAILQHLETRGEILQEKVTPINSEGLRDVMKGPELRPGTSTFSEGYNDDDLDITVTVKRKKSDIVDITPKDKQDDDA